MTEERGGQRQTGDGDRLAAVHHPGKARIGRDDALGGDVVAAAREAFAEIFSERSVDKGTEVEAWDGECIHAVTLQTMKNLCEGLTGRQHRKEKGSEQLGKGVGAINPVDRLPRKADYDQRKSPWDAALVRPTILRIHTSLSVSRCRR